MVISLESFQNVTVGRRGIARVGGGVRLGNLATGIYNQSQRALPHGVCPGVGIGGHATHGGYCRCLETSSFPTFNICRPCNSFPGYSSRVWGLTIDNIIGLDVVLANGSAIHATSTAFADIFWVGKIQDQVIRVGH